MLSFRNVLANSLAVTLILIAASKAVPQGIADTKLSDQVVERMADIALAHADLNSKRHVFVASDKKTTIRRGVLEDDELPILYVFAKNPSKHVSFAASASETHTINTLDLVQNWNQVFKSNGKIFYRHGDPLKTFNEYQDKEGEPKPKAITYHPIIHSLDFASRYTRESSVDMIELLALRNSSRISSRFTEIEWFDSCIEVSGHRSGCSHQ